MRGAGRTTLAALLLFALGGCASGHGDLARGTAAYERIPAPTSARTLPAYRIGALDVIAVSVFQEPDLTVQDVQVDSGGNVVLPLVGQVRAAGLSANDFAKQLAARLSVRYLVDPQVSVIVTSSASQHVTVEGAVTAPGVFAISGRTTLLDAMALAKGPTRIAQANDIVVFRTIEGQQMGALFDLAMIRTGRAADPEILGDDTIVVGSSALKAAFRDVLANTYALSLFQPLAVR